MSEKKKNTNEISLRSIFQKFGKGLQREGFISVKYGDSPVIRDHVELDKSEYEVLAYGVSWATCYIVYQRRKRVYAYAIVTPPIHNNWAIHAQELPPEMAMRLIREMDKEGYDTKILDDPIKRRQKYIGKLLGTIRVYCKDIKEYSWRVDEADELVDDIDEPLDETRASKYWVYDFGKGDIRIFDEELPKSNVSLKNEAMFANAVPVKYFDEYIQNVKSYSQEHLKKTPRKELFVKFDVPDEVVEGFKKKALLHQI